MSNDNLIQIAASIIVRNSTIGFEREAHEFYKVKFTKYFDDVWYNCFPPNDENPYEANYFGEYEIGNQLYYLKLTRDWSIVDSRYTLVIYKSN